MRQPVDKSRQHRAHLFLRFQCAAFGLGLLEDHVLQTALHIIQTAQRQRWRGRAHQCVDLAFKPAVIHAQLANVLNDELKQVQQRGLDLGLVLSRKRHSMPKIGQHGLYRGDVCRRLANGLEHLPGLLGKAHIILTQSRLDVLDQACNLLQKILGKFGSAPACRRAGRGRGFCGKQRTKVGCGPARGCGSRRERAIGHQRILDALPIELANGIFKKAFLLLLARGLGRQCCRNVAEHIGRERHQAFGARHLVVGRLVDLRGRGLLARGQQPECVACNLVGGALSHRGAPGKNTVTSFAASFNPDIVHVQVGPRHKHALYMRERGFVYLWQSLNALKP